jgi:preprotein translocase subunit SecA
MTGTARGCQQEITRDYKIPLVFLPARLPPQREEFSPQIFTSKKLKYLFIVQELKQQSESGRAILVGTTSIQESQELADLLMSYRLNHRVLNAIQDAHEAEVVSKAGEAGQITIATNMAGRGTDIKISAEVRKTGGLHIILTGMQASSRLDRQMIGRCARQGEPGSFCYRLSLEDDLIQQLPAIMQHEFATLNKQADRYGLLPTACFKNFKQAQIYLERNSKDSFSRNHKYAVARNQLVKYLEIPVELVTS